MSEQSFIIVGAGLAGAKAAESLRGYGFDGSVVLIGSEPERLDSGIGPRGDLLPA